MWTPPLNSAYSITLSTKFQFKLIISIFWTKFAQKGCSRSKTERVNITIEFNIFELLHVTNFNLNWQFWFFGTNLPKKGDSGWKQKKVNITIECYVFELVYVPNFSLNRQFLFFGPSSSKKSISSLKRIKLTHHWILHIQISLTTKFQLKLTILNFWTKFA